MPQQKFHLTPKGQARPCSATIQCRYAEDGVVPEHYDTKEEAQAAYEKQAEKEHGGVKGFKKKTRKTENLDVSTHVISNTASKYKYPELDGKTVAEVRQYVIDMHNEYDGKEEEIAKNIAEYIGIENLDDYSTDVNIGRTLELSESFYDGSIPQDEYVDSGDYDPYDYMQEGLNELDGYIYSEISIGGYYNDENYVNSYFEIPDSFDEEVRGLNAFKKYDQNYNNASNENLPDWASLPKRYTMDGLDKESMVHEKTQFSSTGRGDKTVHSIPIPKKPANINKLNKIINNHDEIDRLKRANVNLAKRSDEAVAQLHEIRDYERLDAAGKRNFVFDKAQEYRGRGKQGRKFFKERLESHIDRLNTTAVQNVDKINGLSAVTNEQKAQAQEQLNNLTEKYENDVKEYKINRLSDYYPHSKKDVRRKHAEEWVNSHPELEANDLW